MALSYTNVFGVRIALQATEASAIREEIATREAVDAAGLVLTVRGTPIVSAELGDEDEIAVSYELPGGKKGKKKKKNFTTPKHVAHKHKKVKLAVLKYYSIEGDSIKSLRTDCVGTCPDGVKMASHLNRLHCGRCGVMVRKGE